MSRTNSHPRSLPGLSVMEVVVALAVFLIGTLSSISLANALIRSTGQSKEQVQLANLAREGLEAARNVRDTNWQRNSGSQRDATGDTRDHWDDSFEDDAALTADGARFVPIAVPLEAGAPIFDAEGWNAYTWSLGSPIPVSDPTWKAKTQLFRHTETGRYTHLADPATVPPEYEPTRFQQWITVHYLEPDPAEPPDGWMFADEKTRTLHITSEVGVRESTDIANWSGDVPARTLVLETILTDWYGRKTKD